jgi:hypothetical protein
VLAVQAVSGCDVRSGDIERKVLGTGSRGVAMNELSSAVPGTRQS